MHDAAGAIAWLRSVDAVRERCGDLYATAGHDALEHFALDESRLGSCADYVVDTVKTAYPDLEVPYHSRWRHFATGGVDRWGTIAAGLTEVERDEIARVRTEVVLVSVILDAGAGESWRYREAGKTYARSEGLALASLRLYASGALSASDTRLRADSEALRRIEMPTLGTAFQVGEDNPLVGLAERARLLRRLGQAMTTAPRLFGDSAPRLGNLFDYLAGEARDSRLAAPTVLGAVHEALGPVWPRRIDIAGANLGDVWRHPIIGGDGLTRGLVPFHKLAQWLTYSLVEPLSEAGLVVTGLDSLTGLAEYRNGGLLIDSGVLRPKHEAVTALEHGTGSEVVVEWRALTVALLDRLAVAVRERLGLDAHAFPLARVLEGGTWRAGRRIALERRPEGGPPIRVASDGTVF